MNKFLATLLIGFFLISLPSWAADFDKGLAAAPSLDYETALREWVLLAEQGNANAQFNLGFMYGNGDGVLQDYKTAVKWYTLAAEQGYADAQFNLGVMYNNGQGVPQDYDAAAKWYIRAAEQGQKNAQSNLGNRYYNGEGVLQDYVSAHMWWNIAASAGIESAANNRGIVAEQMTPSQLEKAQDLARACVAKEYKGC